jgi:light-regulated signal transduction histidine kinase (bacteriophytochrome)
MNWVSSAPAEVIQYKRRLLLRDSSWLLDVEPNSSGVKLNDGSLIDLFCERGGDEPSILRQFAQNADGEKIRRLVIISPYWDANLGALRQLRKALSDCPTVIALNPAKNTFPIDALKAKDDVSFVLMKTTKIDPKRFPHAKMLLIETATADHVLFGSTVCCRTETAYESALSFIMDASRSHCDTDSVRLVSAILPHGALLVLDGESGHIEAASESCKMLLGLNPAEILGRPIAAVLPSLTLARLCSGLGPDLQPLIPLSRAGHELRVRAHRNAADQLLVDIEPAGEDFASVHGTVYERRRTFAAVRRLQEIPRIAHAACELVRDLTGFDRVLVYRFDADWNGEVIGEDCDAEIEPYLGLWYPASDIPLPARELALTAHPRQIPDARYSPSALMARGSARSIDLGASSLRSVAASHVTYLHHMGVRATLVGSLLVDGGLWGLVMCHHRRSPKYLGPAVRDAVEWLCQDLAALIQVTQTEQRRARALNLSLRRRNLADRLRVVDFKALMRQPDGISLLEVVAADGFALLEEESLNTLGSTPSLTRIRELALRRRERDGAETLYATSSLTREMALEDAADGVAGALFVSLHDRPDCTLIWFRDERRLPVYWGGDIESARQIDEHGRMVPRASFARFLQEIRGRSVPWSVEELDSAAELGSLIEIEALREREAFAQTILNSSPFEKAVLNTQGVIVSVNETWRRLTAEHSSPGAPVHAIGSQYQSATDAMAGKPRGEDAARAWAGIQGVLHRASAHFTLDYPSKVLGEHHWFRMTVYPMLAPLEGAVVVCDDITDRKNAEVELEKHRHHLESLVNERTVALTIANQAAELAHRASEERLLVEAEAKMQSRKLEAVGTLAAGIAHDFNNILCSMIGFAEMTADELPPESRGGRNIAHILTGGFRARDLIARMLTFAREGPSEPVTVDIAEQVQEALALLRASLPPSIDLVFKDGLDGAHATLSADPTYIMQIIMNLCINAAHAMDNSGLVQVDLRPARRIPDVPPEYLGGICLTVVDQGSGMTPEILARVFDPFFTTKAPGAGSGLGLSVIHGIVSGLGGAIRVHSSVAVGRTGTQFEIFLPLNPSLPTGETHGPCAVDRR